MFDNTLEDTQMTLGKRIKELRGNKSITQEELAQILGTTRPTLSNWELDRTRPDYDMIKKITDYFNVTIDYIVSGDTEGIIPGAKIVIYDNEDRIIDISMLPPEVKKQVDDYIKFLKDQYINKK
jgi:transcriptional regulator with XRE-family HTH domain